jgi:hypothetical protein
LFSLSLPTESDVIETATDRDLIIIAALFVFSSLVSTLLLLFFCCDRNTDQNDDDLVLEVTGEVSLGSVSVPTNRDLERRKGIASDLERRKAGSLSMRLETREVGPPKASCEKREKEEEEEEEDDVVAAVVVVAQQAHGRTLAQSGQRVARRSRRQTEQIPLRRRFEGCFGHFQTSSSSMFFKRYKKRWKLCLDLFGFVFECGFLSHFFCFSGFCFVSSLWLSFG